MIRCLCQKYIVHPRFRCAKYRNRVSLWEMWCTLHSMTPVCHLYQMYIKQISPCCTRWNTTTPIFIERLNGSTKTVAEWSILPKYFSLTRFSPQNHLPCYSKTGLWPHCLNHLGNYVPCAGCLLLGILDVIHSSLLWLLHDILSSQGSPHKLSITLLRLRTCTDDLIWKPVIKLVTM